MKSQTLTIPYEITPASRPRVTKYGSFYNKTYTAFREVVTKWLGSQKTVVMEGPLEATVSFYMKTPKNWSQKKQGLVDGKYVLSKKGDIDNLLKAVFDVLQGHCFVDDSQIVRVHAEKRWERVAGEITITLTKIDDGEAV